MPGHNTKINESGHLYIPTDVQKEDIGKEVKILSAPDVIMAISKNADLEDVVESIEHLKNTVELMKDKKT